MATDLFKMYKSCHYLEQVTESETRYLERICREHHTIVNMQISGNSTECKKFKNIKKNRFENIQCWDSTRVRLIKQRPNYIHANYVDGFEQVRKFIVTQEPMDNTIEDYWSMVWQAGTRIIVMLNSADVPAVPCVSDYSNQLKGFIVTVKRITLHYDYIEKVMNVFNLETMQSRIVHFFKYLSWPKDGVTDILALINFMIVVNDRHYHYNQPDLMNPPGPIVIYSITGTGRAPMFCAVDICIFQLVNSAIVSIPTVVFGIRQQRHSSFESLDDYFFINNVIVYFLATIPPNSELFMRFLCYRSLCYALSLSNSPRVN